MLQKTIRVQEEAIGLLREQTGLRPVDCRFAAGDNAAYQAGASDGRPVGERQIREPDAAFFGSILPSTEELAEET